MPDDSSLDQIPDETPDATPQLGDTAPDPGTANIGDAPTSPPPGRTYSENEVNWMLERQAELENQLEHMRRSSQQPQQVAAPTKTQQAQFQRYQGETDESYHERWVKHVVGQTIGEHVSPIVEKLTAAEQRAMAAESAQQTESFLDRASSVCAYMHKTVAGVQGDSDLQQRIETQITKDIRGLRRSNPNAVITSEMVSARYNELAQEAAWHESRIQSRNERRAKERAEGQKVVSAGGGGSKSSGTSTGKPAGLKYDGDEVEAMNSFLSKHGR